MINSTRSRFPSCFAEDFGSLPRVDAYRGDLDRPSTREQISQRDERPLAPVQSREDVEISGRRAAVRLSRALHRPRYEAEPPKRKLDRFIQRQRDTGTNYEAQINAEQRGERVGKFRQEIEPDYDERNTLSPGQRAYGFVGKLTAIHAAGHDDVRAQPAARPR